MTSESEETTESAIETAAAAAVESVLTGGQSVTQGDMSVSKASLRDAHAVLMHEEQRQSRKTGRRPLFRGMNLGGIA